ncbi:MAG: hypothetical protein GY716_08010 [bacterium]|nr:hypothetical protein [bacterium]
MSLSSFLGISGEVRISMFASSSLPGAAGDVLQIEFEFVGPPGSRSPLALARSWINERQAPASFDDGFVAVCSGADADTDGFSSCDGDCDDAAPDRFPGNPEICDGLDNDCDLTLPPDEIDADEDGLSECEGDCDPLDPTNAPAPAVGDSLRGDRSASTIELTWDAEGIAGTYAVHRGVLLPTASFSYNHACLIDGLIDAEAFDADVPDPGGGFYYLVSREDPCGESGLGEDGDGTARPGGTACP